MAKMPKIEMEIVWMNKTVIEMIARYLNIEVIDSEAFAQRINEAMVSFIIPRLMIEQMKSDGIIKVKA